MQQQEPGKKSELQAENPKGANLDLRKPYCLECWKLTYNQIISLRKRLR